MLSTKSVYPNPIECKNKFNLGATFILHANPRLPSLEEGDIVNLKLETEASTYGRAVILNDPTLGNNTYRARRTE